MKTKPSPCGWFAVQTPEMEKHELAMVFVGRTQPAGAGHTSLCSPSGEPLFSVESRYVRPLTQAELVQRIQEDAQWRQQQRERERIVRATLCT